MMNYANEFQSALDQVIQSPKTLATISVATASMGAASFTDVARGALSLLAILAGVIATLLLCRVHWAKYKNERLQNRILRQQLLDMGVTDTDS